MFANLCLTGYLLPVSMNLISLPFLCCTSCFLKDKFQAWSSVVLSFVFRHASLKITAFTAFVSVLWCCDVNV
jgi:hypothetical protein